VQHPQRHTATQSNKMPASSGLYRIKNGRVLDRLQKPAALIFIIAYIAACGICGKYHTQTLWLFTKTKNQIKSHIKARRRNYRKIMTHLILFHLFMPLIFQFAFRLFCTVHRTRFNSISVAVMHEILSKDKLAKYEIKCGKYHGRAATKATRLPKSRNR